MLAAHSQVVISEFMASNQTTVLDDFGEASDWVEIYNAGGSPVDLGGYYLTDNLSNLTQWRFPSTNLPPHRYLLVFASGYNVAQAGRTLHTNFQLSENGEEVALVAPDSATVLSHHVFGPQTPDVSMGLATDSLDSTNLVPAGVSGRVIVPLKSYAASWTLQGFDDSAWLPSTAGIGYDTNSADTSLSSLFQTDLRSQMFGPRPRSRPPTSGCQSWWLPGRRTTTCSC